LDVTPAPITKKRARKAAPKEAVVAPVAEETEAPITKRVPSREGKE
jgi:hypothetical protein